MEPEMQRNKKNNQLRQFAAKNKLITGGFKTS